MIKALYVHIPFCKSKCSYCDFTSFSQEEKTYEAYINSLLRELEFKRKEYGIEEVDSIYIGGGTPTVLPPFLLEKILLYIRENFIFPANYEFTVEANPESLTLEKALLLNNGGVNRISMGAQSFDKEVLKFLGRIHSPEETREAFFRAREAGFKNINLDLIYGVPGQSFKSWQESLRQALELEADHYSLYQLKIEADTPLETRFSRGDFDSFPDDKAEEIYKWNLAFMEEKGYLNYEFSNYSRPGFRSRHNLNYWNYLPYAGAGFGAVGNYGSYRSDFKGSLEEYLLKERFTVNDFEKEFLSEKDQIFEYLIMNLRKNEGFSLADFQEKFHVSFLKTYSKQWDKLEGMKLLETRDGAVFLTLRGRLISNLVFMEFI